MPKVNKNNAAALWEAVIRSVADIGIDQTTEGLRNHHSNFAPLTADAKFVIHMVAKRFKIPEKEIFQGFYRKNERRDAIGFCVYYLNNQLKYDMREVAIILKRNISVCYKCARRIKKLDGNKVVDAKYMRYMHDFDCQIKSQLQS
jgi:hypothetical protein